MAQEMFPAAVLYDGIKRVQRQEQKKIKKPVTIKVTGSPKQ
jgi:hypothetical protein